MKQNRYCLLRQEGMTNLHAYRQQNYRSNQDGRPSNVNNYSLSARYDMYVPVVPRWMDPRYMGRKNSRANDGVPSLLMLLLLLLLLLRQQQQWWWWLLSVLRLYSDSYILSMVRFVQYYVEPSTKYSTLEELATDKRNKFGNIFQ